MQRRYTSVAAGVIMSQSDSIDQVISSPLNFIMGLIVLAAGGFLAVLAVRLLFFS
jgi:hypothetical protein